MLGQQNTGKQNQQQTFNIPTANLVELSEIAK